MMTSLQSRRGFLKRACALGACAVSGEVIASAFEHAKLRIGVLSDLHLAQQSAVDRLELAFRHFRDCHVDGILICGDLTDHGIVPELTMLAEAWARIFPGNMLPDGSPVERLFHYGDHDAGGYAHTKKFFHSGEWLMKKYGVSYETVCSWSIRGQEKEVWEQTFGESWSPIMHKKVKGYDFVLANFTMESSQSGNMIPGLLEFFKSFRPDSSRPFFYSQHRVHRHTTGGPFAWGQDNGSSKEVLSHYPNCVAFSGHGHLSATDEKAIWQGLFTAIEVPSLKYVQFPGDHENYEVSALRQKAGIPAQMPKLDVYQSQQGMLMTVYDDRVVVDRIDFGSDEPLGPSWIIPTAREQRPYAPAERRSRAVAPRFPKGAKVLIRSTNRKEGKVAGERQLIVEFDLAQPTERTPRAFDYEVTLAAIVSGGPVSPVVHKVYSPRAFSAPAGDKGPGLCVFSRTEFPTGSADFYAEVVPCDAFGVRGQPIGVACHLP